METMNVGDRVKITAPTHPWYGHTGKISRDASDLDNPYYQWVVKLDKKAVYCAVREDQVERVE